MDNFQTNRRVFIYSFTFFHKYSLSSYDDSDIVWGARNVSQTVSPLMECIFKFCRDTK